MNPYGDLLLNIQRLGPSGAEAVVRLAQDCLSRIITAREAIEDGDTVALAVLLSDFEADVAYLLRGAEDRRRELKAVGT